MSSSDESGSDRESHDDSSVGLSSFKPLSSPKSTRSFEVSTPASPGFNFAHVSTTRRRR